MMNSQTIQSLIEPSQIYQLASEHFEGLDFDAENVLNFESGLVEMVLELYNGNGADLSTDLLQKFSLLEVIHYLQASHQLYISKTLPEIEQSMYYIQQKSEDTPEILKALAVFFDHYKVNFLEHIQVEEEGLFAYLLQLQRIYTEETNKEELVNFLINNTIEQFVEVHDAIEDDLRHVSKIIHHYAEGQAVTLPFKVFLNQVELFEADLKKHAIIEDHVLVPLARMVENELRRRI